MSDLISRDLAVKAMMALEAEDIADYGCSIPEGFDGKRASDALRKLPSEWETIPPKKNGMYFVTTDKGGKRSVTMSGYRDEWIVEGVVAWMPIPEPFGGENGKNS